MVIPREGQAWRCHNQGSMRRCCKQAKSGIAADKARCGDATRSQAQRCGRQGLGSDAVQLCHENAQVWQSHEKARSCDASKRLRCDGATRRPSSRKSIEQGS